MKRILLAAWLLISVLFMSCAQYDREVGSGLVDDDLKGILYDTLVYIDSSATMISGDIFKSSPANLPLGQQNGFVSDILVLFDNFETFTDTTDTSVAIQWTSAELWLYGFGFVDSTETTDFTPWNATVYRIDEDWDPLDYTYEDSLALTPIDTALFGSAESYDSVMVAIDSTTLSRWIDGDTVLVEDDTTGAQEVISLAYGLRIVPDNNAAFLKNIVSRSASSADKLPRILVHGIHTDLATETDSVFTDTVYADLTTFLVDDISEHRDDRLYLSEGYLGTMLFWNNFEEILPEAVSINKVELMVYFDEETPELFGNTDILVPYDIVENWFDEPDSAKIGTFPINVFYEVVSDTNLVRLDVTPLARLWLASPEDNHGVAVRTSQYFYQIGRRLFYDVTAENAVRPKFRIVYTGFEL